MEVPAMLDGELAVPCTRNPLQRGRTPPRGRPLLDCPHRAVMKTGSCAAGTREPRQVRKEATVSGQSWVPQGFLVGAGQRG
jgi:hypothetical protein